MGWNGALVDSQILAVHAALVPVGDHGEVVLFGGDEHWSAQQESAGGDLWKKTRVYDVRTHSIVSASVPSPDSDVFCAHHAFAADGRLLIAGGTSKWPQSDAHVHGLDFLGHNRSWIYNPHTHDWVEVATLNRNPDQPDEAESGGRWYPGCVTLANGDVLATFGHLMQEDYRHRNTLPERYNQAANTWILAPKAMADPLAPGSGVRYLFYARAFTLPDGSVFFATPMPTDFAAAASGDGTYSSTRYDPSTGDYEGFEIPEPGSGTYHDWSRPAVLLPLLPGEDWRPRVLFCGDTTAIKIDLGVASPNWQNTPPRAGAVSARTRTYSNAVLLPTGQVCLVGGVDVVDPEDPVLQAEIYDPGIDWGADDYGGSDSWAVKESAQLTRNYHSVALLLPNGKVWTAGGNDNANSGNPDDVGVKQIELYEPDYVAVANRIQISDAPRFAAYGQPFEIMLDRAATNVGRVALIRNGSVTHSTNNDQRYVGLEITGRNGNTLTVTAPPTSAIAPPGYYMLWVVDNTGNPCQLARFVRMAHVGCRVVTDRSTFAMEEIDSLGGGGQVTITNAIYVYFDGFIDGELPGTPTFGLTWTDTNGAVASSELTLVGAGRLLESSPPHPDVPQRVTFAYHVRFPNLSAFAGVVDERNVRLTFTLGPFSCSETIDLTKSPNPYMLDVDPASNNPHWLSTDVRVFPTVGGSTYFSNVNHGTTDASAITFIRDVVDKFNAAPEGPAHPFNSIATGQSASALALASDIVGMRLFNYAVAKVRYRATATTAQDVKVFFRLFNTVGTALEYNTSTTYRVSPGPDSVPLLGTAGGEIVSIPCFATERVETVQGQPGATSMLTQPLDSREIQDIAPGAGSEVTAYFGCWLDINRTRKRFPINPGGADGPWAGASCRSIQELVRGRHQCLVAEVFFPPDATDPGETPGTSDNLSQRNLAILFSDNPGGPASHRVMHTFEIKPSELPKIPPNVPIEAVPVRGAKSSGSLTHVGPGFRQRTLPDELLVRWWNLPSDSEVTLHLGGTDTDEVVRLAGLRLSPAPFTRVDDNTLRLGVAGTTWIPLPGGRQTHIPALLTIQLPDGVTAGTTYRVSVHQVDGRTGRVIGAVEISIPVSKAALIVDDEIRDLSVMKHILSTIPPDNRWYPVFKLYVSGLGDRVDALGGDPGSVHGNPDGSGDPYTPPKPDDGRHHDLCDLIVCLLSERVISAELEKKISEAGIDLNAVRRCLAGFCRDHEHDDVKRPEVTEGGAITAAPPHENALGDGRPVDEGDEGDEPARPEHSSTT